MKVVNEHGVTLPGPSLTSTSSPFLHPPKLPWTLAFPNISKPPTCSPLPPPPCSSSSLLSHQQLRRSRPAQPPRPTSTSAPTNPGPAHARTSKYPPENATTCPKRSTRTCQALGRTRGRSALCIRKCAEGRQEG